MEENNNQEAVQTEPVVESSPNGDSPRPESTEAPSVTESLRQAQNEGTQGEEVSEPTSTETEKGGDDTERKQSRAERRVETLVEKLKQQGQNVDPSLVYGDEPLFTPEEIESGQFDPTALSERLQRREARNRQLAEQQVMQRLEYNNSINEHLSDTEVAQKELSNDPDLEKLVVRQYNALNMMTDPRTGQEVFVPRVKMSDIVKEMKAVIEKKSNSSAADIQAKLNAQANDQAVPVSVSQSSSTNLAGEQAFTKARQSGQVEDWAAVLKAKLKK